MEPFSKESTNNEINYFHEIQNDCFLDNFGIIKRLIFVFKKKKLMKSKFPFFVES